MEGMGFRPKTKLQSNLPPVTSTGIIASKQEVHTEKKNVVSDHALLFHRTVVEETKVEAYHIRLPESCLVFSPVYIAEKLGTAGKRLKLMDPTNITIEGVVDSLDPLPDIYVQLTKLLNSPIEQSIKDKGTALLEFQFGRKGCIYFSLKEIVDNKEACHSCMMSMGDPCLIYEDLMAFKHEIIELKSKIDSKLNSSQGRNAQLTDSGENHPLVLQSDEKASSLIIHNAASCHEEDTVFLQAARSGDYNTILQCIQNREELNQTDYFGKTPLMTAALFGHKEIVELLIDNGASINLIDRSRRTLLMHAILSGNIELVKLVHAKQPSLSCEDEYGKSILMHAANSGSYDVFDYFLSQGLTIEPKKETILHQNMLNLAAAGGNVDVVSYLLKNGFSLDTQSSTGRTALMSSIMNNKSDCVKFLISSGCNLQRKDQHGRTALMHAVRSGFIDMVKLLIDSGVDVNAVDNDGCPALFYAANNDELHMTKLIIKSGANLSLKDHKGRDVIGYIKYNKHYSNDRSPTKTESYISKEMLKRNISQVFSNLKCIIN